MTDTTQPGGWLAALGRALLGLLNSGVQQPVQQPATAPAKAQPDPLAIAADIIREFEGCKLLAYLCPADVWTIGWGATGQGIGPGVTWTRQQADDRLMADIRRFADGVAGLVTAPLTPHQRAALISFAFNLGLGALRTSTLLRKLNDLDYRGAADEFPRWTKATVKGQKVDLPGLVRRRAAERDLFLTP